MSKDKILSALFNGGHRQLPKGKMFYVFVIASFLISLFEIWLGSIGNLSPYYYSVVFITGILPLAVITTRFSTKQSENPSLFDYVFALLVLLAGMHLILKMDHLLTRIQGVDKLTALDMTAGIILVIAVIELCRRTLGFGLTFILLMGIAYSFFGHLIPGTFGHRELSLERFVDEMVFTSDGIFGSAVQVAATYAFLFIMFGHVFQKAGAGQFIFDMAASIMGKKIGGLAKVAVTTAGAFGSISGSPTSDVATTGSINIPMMKKRGYKPEFAGAVEAASASGGTILPPIMGSVAFIMAEFTGIPYFEIAMASVLSAVLFYLGIYWQVHFRSLKRNLVGMDANEIPSIKETLKKGFYFFIPVIVLVWAMEHGFTPSLAASYAIAVTFLLSFVRKETRILFKDIVDIFTDVVYSIAPLTVAVAAAGIIIGVINLTGLAGKFTTLIFSITGETVFLSLVVGAAICIILGMGMPTPSAYVLVAALVAPALREVGVDLLPTHLFLVFFCAMSAITPPVGVAAYTAAGIANANPLAIGIQATKLASVGFVIPFMFVYQPSLMLQGNAIDIIFSVITALIGVYALAIGMEGYFKTHLVLWEKALVILTAIGMIYPNILLNVVCAVVLAFIFIKNYKKKKSEASVNEVKHSGTSINSIS